MNERADPDELDRRIDLALGRRFEPPRTLDALAERALGSHARARRPGRHLGRRIALALAVAAAALFVWLAPWRTAPSSAPLRLAAAPEEGLAPARSQPRPVSGRTVACRPVGPLESSAGMPTQVHSPDLAQLYSAMDACQRSAAALPCPENDGLAESLRATYGSELELSPDAVGFLQGPFASADWPTATILTGFAEEHTSVLVAERDATLDCCLCMQLSEQSGLSVFTWKVGDLVLTEITPLSEPRLLQFFE